MIYLALVLSVLAFVGSVVSVVVTLATSRRLDQARDARIARRPRGKTPFVPIETRQL